MTLRPSGANTGAEAWAIAAGPRSWTSIVWANMRWSEPQPRVASPDAITTSDRRIVCLHDAMAYPRPQTKPTRDAIPDPSGTLPELHPSSDAKVGDQQDLRVQRQRPERPRDGPLVGLRREQGRGEGVVVDDPIVHVSGPRARVQSDLAELSDQVPRP